MGSLVKIDRATPIGYQKTHLLSDEALQLFPDLELSFQEKEWCNCTPAELSKEKLGRNDYAVKVFTKKLDCCELVDALFSANPEPVRWGIESLSRHIAGGALERYFFRQAHKIRSNANLQKRIQPVLDHLIDAAFDESSQYVHSAQPDVLDHHYRNFFIFATTVARLNPTLTPPFHGYLSEILRPFKNELSPYLFLASLRAMGYASCEISEWDIEYVQPWRSDPGSEDGQARGANIAAYNASPLYGWELLQMHPRDAKRFIQEHRHSILRSLVLGMHGKCCYDPAANVAWLAARFFKLHLSLHVIDGRNAYGKLPHVLMPKVLAVADTVGRAVRSSSETFPGKTELKRIVGAVEFFLKTELPTVRNSS